MRRRKRKNADKRLLKFDNVYDGMLDMKIVFNNNLVRRVPVNNLKFKKNCELKGNWCNYFNNRNNPIHIEVGSGRCKFITEMAKKYKDINFIACDLKEEFLYKGVEISQRDNIENILFLWGNAEFFDYYFSSGELSRIYINFCDPWPKKRHSKKRLTHKLFLNTYRDKLVNGEIHFKTDNEKKFFTNCLISSTFNRLRILLLIMYKSFTVAKISHTKA